MQSVDQQGITIERVVLDASALLSGRRSWLLAATDLRFYIGYWSSWTIAEVVRKRTEWIAERAVRDGVSPLELRRRLLDSRQRLNALIAELSEILRTVDYSDAPAADLSWLKDPDDWPVMQMALAVEADVLVTDNSNDFPLGEHRNDILILGSEQFLSALYTTFPEAEAAVQAYLLRARSSQ